MKEDNYTTLRIGDSSVGVAFSEFTEEGGEKGEWITTLEMIAWIQLSGDDMITDEDVITELEIWDGE